MTKAALISSFIFLALVSHSPPAQAIDSVTNKARQCELLLTYGTTPNKNLPELRALVRRVFEKDHDPKTEDRKRDSTGFLVQTNPKDLRYWCHPFKAVKQFVPRKVSESRLGTKHDLEIMDGINHHYGNFTEKRGKRKQLTAFSLLLGSLILTSPTIPIQVRGYELSEAISADLWVDGGIAFSWSEWRDNVKYDYRNHLTNLELKQGEITQLEASQEAYRLKLVYKNYHEYLRDKNIPKDYAHKKFLFEKLELFSHVEQLKDYMMGDRAAFFEIHPGPMTEDQEAKVFKLDEDLLLNYEIVSTWVQMGAPPVDILPQTMADFKSKMTSIFDSSGGFAQSLVYLRDHHLITNLQLQYLLQRDLADQHEFDTRNLLGLIPHKFENGDFTEDLDTTSLKDLRTETLNNIKGNFEDLEASN